MVDYKTYIRLIYPHTKGNGSYHHIYIFHKKHVLVPGTGFCIKPRMIWYCTNTVYLQYLCYFLNFFTAKAVNNTRLAFMVSYKTDYIRLYIFGFRAYLIIQVWPVE